MNTFSATLFHIVSFTFFSYFFNSFEGTYQNHEHQIFKNIIFICQFVPLFNCFSSLFYFLTDDKYDSWLPSKWASHFLNLVSWSIPILSSFSQLRDWIDFYCIWRMACINIVLGDLFDNIVFVFQMRILRIVNSLLRWESARQHWCELRLRGFYRSLRVNFLIFSTKCFETQRCSLSTLV